MSCQVYVRTSIPMSRTYVRTCVRTYARNSNNSCQVLINAGLSFVSPKYPPYVTLHLRTRVPFHFPTYPVAPRHLLHLRTYALLHLLLSSRRSRALRSRQGAGTAALVALTHVRMRVAGTSVAPGRVHTHARAQRAHAASAAQSTVRGHSHGRTVGRSASYVRT